MLYGFFAGQVLCNDLNTSKTGGQRYCTPGQPQSSSPDLVILAHVASNAYVAELERWGIMADGPNPVARSNVCPELSPPVEPSFHTFCFTLSGADRAPSFAASGSAEVPEERPTFRDHIIRRGDVSPAGFKEKVRFVVAEMEARMASLGCRWPDATATQIYTVHDIHPLLPEEILDRGNASSDVTWHYCRPPVIELEFEMDCRAIHHERIIAG